MTLTLSFCKGLLFAYFVSILITFCACADKDFRGGGVRCKVHGQSGKISIIQGKETLTCEVDSIGEVNASGADVGRKGGLASKHGVETLANQQFSFSSLDENAYYQGIKAININQSSSISGPSANMEIMIFLFLEDGNVTFGNESFAVFNGSLKFNIQIKNWTFCSAAEANCKSQGGQNEVGAFIDLDLKCKGKGEKPKKISMEDRENKKKRKVCFKKPGKTCPQIYDMGGNSEMLLSPTIKQDGNFSSMPDSYPKVVAKGNSNVFKFRIPKFSNMVIIDPVVNTGSVSGGEGGDGDGDSDGDGDGDGDGDKDGASTLPFNFLAFALLLNVAAMFAM